MKRKNSLIYLSALLIIALQFDLFYLMDTEFKLGQGLLVVFSLLIILKYSNGKLDKNNSGIFLMIYFGILMITSAYQSGHLFPNYNSMIGAFLAERVYWVYIFFYFAFLCLYRRKIFTYKKVKSLLYTAGVIQLVLYFFQYFISDKLIFVHVVTGMRYGAARFYFQPILLVFLFCIALSDYLNGIKKISNLIYMLLIFLEIVLIQKYRMSLLSLFIAVGGTILVYKGSNRQLIKIFFIVLMACAILLNTRIGQDIIASLQNVGKDNSVSGREVWRSWAFTELQKRPILGNGFSYTTESNEYAAQPVGKLFGWSFTPGDHGIFGFIYEYGLLGAIWFLLFIITQLKRALYVSKYRKKYVYLTYMFFIFIDSYSELYWIYSNGIFALCVFIVMLDSEYREIKTINRNALLERNCIYDQSIIGEA